MSMASHPTKQLSSSTIILGYPRNNRSIIRLPKQNEAKKLQVYSPTLPIAFCHWQTASRETYD
ncbi:MAG: hypothetical protein ACQXXH_08460 [Candidatus Bathyarchaeia archaeon]|nr:hypothetical protein [Candidatus Bathyarchaeota archaeon A05DMB-4]MDH7595198.1 hypothetical protein [Candidatus Bathyarchaeota archaeon]